MRSVGEHCDEVDGRGVAGRVALEAAIAVVGVGGGGKGVTDGGNCRGGSRDTLMEEVPIISRCLQIGTLQHSLTISQTGHRHRNGKCHSYVGAL